MKNKHHEDQQQDQEMNNSTKLEMEEKQPLIFIQVFKQIYRAIIWCLLGFREIPSATRTSTADDISSGSTSCEGNRHHQPNIPLENRVCEDSIDGNKDFHGDNDNVNDGDDDDDGCGEGDGYGGGGGNGGGDDGGGDGDDGNGDGVIEPGTDFTPVDSEGIETKALRKPQRPGIGSGRPGQIH